MWWLVVVALTWADLGYSYPMGAKRYGGLVAVGPRLYYEPDPLDLYYPGPSEVQPYRSYSPPLPPTIYDYLPYSYYQEEPAYQEEDPEDQQPAPDDRDDDWTRDRTDKLFLHNLVLAQMYQDALDKLYGYYPGSRDSSYVYGEKIDSPAKQGRRDDEVQQLKSLEESDKKKSSAFREEMARRRSPFPDNKWTDNNKRADKGQDEVVLARPSPPRPSPPSFRESAHRAYQPSPYDSVKKLLQLQDKLEQEAADAEVDEPVRNRQHKRSYVSSEESLVQQLGDLKKSP